MLLHRPTIDALSARNQAALRLFWLVLLLFGATLPASAETTPRQYVYNACNQLTDVTDAANPARTITFTYDANGNRETKTQGGVTTTNRWDARNRLREVSRGGAWVARYDYNSAGRRTFKEVSGPTPTAVRYVYDGPQLIGETNVIGNTLARHHYSADGRLLSLQRNGQHYFYLLDGLGTPIAMTSAEGLVVVRYRVDAWGNPVATVGDSANNFGFTGYPVDDETGLHNTCSALLILDWAAACCDQQAALRDARAGPLDVALEAPPYDQGGDHEDGSHRASDHKGPSSRYELIAQRRDRAAKVRLASFWPNPGCFSGDWHGHSVAHPVVGKGALPRHHDDSVADHAATRFRSYRLDQARFIEPEQQGQCERTICDGGLC